LQTKKVFNKISKQKLMTGIDFDDLFNSFSNIKIAVVGDVMLDTYWWGKVDRISPEAPVPVVAVTKKEQRIGGAGNVALNLAALNVDVHAITVLGNDDEGKQLLNLLNTNNIKTNYIVESEHRITTNKIRIISRNQHMMRLDAEVISFLNNEEEVKLITSFSKYVAEEKPTLVILEDYNKGVLSKEVITEIIKICKQNNILTAVDPKKKNFFVYIGVDIFKPNLQEIKEALNIVVDDISEKSLIEMHNVLHEKLQHNISFITLSEKGVFYKTISEAKIIPTHIRSIADVSGAGDTVIAVASAVYAATQNVQLMAEMANIAGGLVCEEVGTVAINKQKFVTECKEILTNK
jgi:D-glycero-beta-D-manno-heptose-7-phosphate kinase